MENELISDPVPKLEKTKKKEKTFISERGYGILKSEFSIREVEKIKNDLTVKPNVNTDYGQNPSSFKIYLESNKKLYLPKHYGISKLGSPDAINLQSTPIIDFRFVGNLRETQMPVINAFMDSCNTNNSYSTSSRGGIISVPCGFGKTVLALYLIYKLKKKSLVIVHKEFLVNQWKERIHQYLPDAKIGRIQGSVIDIENCDIVIGMLQSLSMKEYEKTLFNDFGFCIIDECHHIAAEIFSRAFLKINSEYMLGLSATPKRKDGLSKVFEWYIGPYVYINKKIGDTRTITGNMIYYENNDSKNELNYMGKICMPKMISNITNFNRRTLFIFNLIKHIISDKNRYLLVLSDRLDHLKNIGELLQNSGISDYGYYIGGMKEKQLKNSESKQVLLATYSMSSEGMDIPSLNTLILGSPKSDIEQSVGRILRKDHKGIIPTVYDIVDNFSVFSNQSTKRLKFYQSKNYQLNTSLVSDTNEVDVDMLLEMALKSNPIVKKSKIIKKKESEKTCVILENDSD